MKQALYKNIAGALQALESCRKRDIESAWESVWFDRLDTDLKDSLPSGSGFDSGSSLDLDASKPDKLVFKTSFHHMNEHGYYEGWSEHSVIITPSLVFGFDIGVTGKDKNSIKDYIAGVFHECLLADHEWKV